MTHSDQSDPRADPRPAALSRFGSFLSRNNTLPLVWTILFGVLALALVSFTVSSLIIKFFNQDMDPGVFATLTQFAAFAFFVGMFFAQAIILAFFAMLIIWSVSKASVYFWMQRHDGMDPQVPKLFSVVSASIVVAVFFSAALRSVFDGLVWASIYVFGTLPQAILSEVDRIITCVSKETQAINVVAGIPANQGAPIRSCIGELVRNDQTLTSSTVNSLTGSGNFQSTQIPQILLAFVVFAAILRIVDAQARTATTVMKFWTAYSLIAAIAIYLSLSATLSVALLLETKSPNSQLTTENLVKQIEDSYPTSPNYDFGALDQTKPLDLIGDTTGIAVLVNGLQVNAEDAKEQVQIMIANMTTEFDAIRNKARSRYSLIDQEDFNSREQALFQQDLLLWAQDSFEAYLARISHCNAVFRSKLQAFRLGGAVHASIQAEISGKMPPELESQMAVFRDVALASNREFDICINASASVAPPEQRQLGSSLGPVGRATGWLLHSQSLALTLVVGLVGYGLLGALISRFVIAKDEGFRIDDPIEFAVVTLAGFVAALVVFVSSFGGMYVLAREATEPNPYAVFALCLGGAIFSSSVWTNLRDRLGNAGKLPDDDAA